MSKCLIIYYSFSGTTQLVAEALAAQLDADLIRIECDTYKKGWLNYLKAGYASAKKRTPPIALSAEPGSGYDLVIVGTPVWAGYPAPPLRSLFAGDYALPQQVVAFMTQGGESPGANALPELKAIVGERLQAATHFRERDVRDGAYEPDLGDFVDQIKSIVGAP